MSRTYTTIAIVVSMWIIGTVLWAWANPGSGAPGTTYGIISIDAQKNVGIGTSTPVSALDVNGTTTIRKMLDMANNKIVNLLLPTGAADAVNKAYADSRSPIPNNTTTSPRLWGRGRPGTTLINNAGECTNVTSGGTLKISRSLHFTTWASANNECPAGWWVCTGTERDVNGATAGYGSCGATLSAQNSYYCDERTAPLYDDYYIPSTTNDAWISDAAPSSTSSISVNNLGTVVNAWRPCDRVPVWCCSY